MHDTTQESNVNRTRAQVNISRSRNLLGAKVAQVGNGWHVDDLRIFFVGKFWKLNALETLPLA